MDSGNATVLRNKHLSMSRNRLKKLISELAINEGQRSFEAGAQKAFVIERLNKAEERRGIAILA